MKVSAEPPELVLLELIGGDFPPALPPVNVDPDEVGGVLTNSLHHLATGLALKAKNNNCFQYQIFKSDLSIRETKPTRKKVPPGL